MNKRKFSDKRLLALVDSNMKPSDIAKKLKVSRQVVYRRIEKLKGKMTKTAIVSKETQQIVNRQIDAIEQLGKINSNANEILDLLMRWNRGEEEALQILESNVKRVKIGESEELTVKEVKFKDPRELALKAMGEIRNQLKLQLDIFQTLFDMKAVKEFQDVVLETIGEVAPDVRRIIIDKLNAKRAIRQSVRFS